MKNLIQKIEKAGIVGRGGGCFPAHLKWQATKKSLSKAKYVVCNGSEGEPGVFKDIYILIHHPEQVIKGMALAMDYLKTKEGYFNFNKIYWKKIKKDFQKKLKPYQNKGYNFTIYEEDPSYIGGEEMALLNSIEGKEVQPRMKPPYSSEVGLFGKPTLVHNVETLYEIAQVEDENYDHTRYYSISGAAKKPGVYKLDKNLNIQEILEQTKNLPKFDFFVQIGGSASGLVLNKDQLKKQKMIGAGSIEIYKSNLKPIKLLKKWFEFYKIQSCGKCTPCREGSYQLHELIKNAKSIPWKKITPIIDSMDKTSFCALGKAIATPYRSYTKNILNKKV